MQAFEWVACLYFAGLALIAPWTRVPGGRRAAVALGCAAGALIVWAAASAAPGPVRAWMPHLYLLSGYWTPALLVHAPSWPTPFERWLIRTDAALRPRLPGVPRKLRPVTELAYLVCYPLVPICFAVVWGLGSDGEVSRFWTAVLLGGYASYGSLPWLVSRPPRLIAAASGVPPRLGAANRFILGLASHNLNTFPSGHVAISVAAAGQVLAVSGLAGSPAALAAIAIAVGASSGRYHYVIDVILGFGVAAGAALVAWAVNG